MSEMIESLPLTKQTKQRPRLRFAPSPTGSLHVGGARTALFNYLYARANDGVFVLRVEDTDQQRSTAAATEQMLASLKWLGINWDEGPGISGTKDIGDYGPYYQSKRLSFYNEHIEKLLKADKAYPCFCQEAELAEKRALSESMGKPYVYDQKCSQLTLVERETQAATHSSTIRFKVGGAEAVFFEDAVKGKMRFTTDLIGDFVIRKSDGFPTYNFAVVVDDSLMKITHVLRGDDHLSNTSRQLLLWEALGYEIPSFAHVPMILGPRKEKLSKRDGATSVLEFAKAGYYPDAFNNHLALLGWSPEDGNEIIARSQLEQAFKALKFSSAPAVFDYKKLDHFNGHVIRSLPEDVVVGDFKNFLKTHEHGKTYLTYPKLDELILTLRGHCRKVADIVGELDKLFNPKADVVAEEKHWIMSEGAGLLFALASQQFSRQTSDFISHDEFKNLMQAAKAELGLKGKTFFIPLRLKLMRCSSGIELDKYFELVERKRILARLQQVET